MKAISNLDHNKVLLFQSVLVCHCRWERDLDLVALRNAKEKGRCCELSLKHSHQAWTHATSNVYGHFGQSKTKMDTSLLIHTRFSRNGEGGLGSHEAQRLVNSLLVSIESTSDFQ
jgi:hypothetical protein